jgi:hypothetical protein
MDKTKKPPAREADGFRNSICLAAISPETNSQALIFQDLRAAWLARRFAVNATMAPIIAALAFGEARA